MSQELTVEFHWGFVDGILLVEVLTRDINQPALAQSLGEGLLRLIESGPASRMVIDFGATKYMSSTAFAALMALSKKAAEIGATIRICNMDSHVRVGADILSLGHFIPIDEHRSESLEKLKV